MGIWFQSCCCPSSNTDPPPPPPPEVNCETSRFPSFFPSNALNDPTINGNGDSPWSSCFGSGVQPVGLPPQAVTHPHKRCRLGQIETYNPTAYVSNWGFSWPGYELTGIQVDIYCYQTAVFSSGEAAGDIRAYGVKLIDSGLDQIGNSLTAEESLPVQKFYPQPVGGILTYGGSDELWGLTQAELFAANIASNNFGFAFWVRQHADSAQHSSGTVSYPELNYAQCRMTICWDLNKPYPP